ncbi:MAG: GIY-YIG nuclease family protein, partial [Desulfofundulus sp.]
SNPGTYILLIFLPEQKTLRVGSLGEIHFMPGWYAYVGSAMRGLRGRVNRHLRKEKKPHWHIDYFLATGILKEVITIESRERIECLISRCLAKRLPPAADRFGSGDCSCRTHLYFAPTEYEMRSAIKGVIKELRIVHSSSNTSLKFHPSNI